MVLPDVPEAVQGRERVQVPLYEREPPAPDADLRPKPSPRRRGLLGGVRERVPRPHEAEPPLLPHRRHRRLQRVHPRPPPRPHEFYRVGDADGVHKVFGTDGEVQGG
ncbi:unnamed protein product [Linum tenue]|uniref:Uncharacterized protein n=1 Tax=Linum tenue TaxID=586396 RepID=A0AAV0JN11_9ROSI|nr:unnamed protein product [Linum tenue]